MTPAAVRKAAQAERARRDRARGDVVSLPVEEILHAGQMAPFLCALATVVICAGRRWGKSVLACVKAYTVALATPDVTCCLIGATQGSISRIFWRTLKLLNRLYLVGGVFLKGVEGWSVTLRNGSQIVLLPVDSIEAADKVRGLSRVAFVCVDESQRYKREILDYLVLDVIKAMFIDLRARGESAQLWMMGTPNPAGQTGTFWDYLTRPGVGRFSAEPDGDSFTVYENSKLGTREQIEAVIEEMLTEEKQSRDSVWYLREVRALWVVDLQERVYQLTDRNLADEVPDGPGELQAYAAGGDIGVKANDAIVGAGWNEASGDVWIVDEETASGQDSIACADMVKAYSDKREPLEVAMDPGGLGQKTILTVKRLYEDIPITEAEKPPVGIQARAVNALLQGTYGWILRIKRDSQLHRELLGPTWVDGIVGGKIDEHGQHSDLVPGLRYLCIKLRKYLGDVDPIRTSLEKAAAEKAARVAATQRANRPRTFEDQFDEQLDDDDVFGA